TRDRTSAIGDRQLLARFDTREDAGSLLVQFGASHGGHETTARLRTSSRTGDCGRSGDTDASLLPATQGRAGDPARCSAGALLPRSSRPSVSLSCDDPRISMARPEGTLVGLLDRRRGRTSASSAVSVAASPPAPPTASSGVPSTAPSGVPSDVPRFAVIDVETTGLDPDRERILDLAIVQADAQGRPIDQWVTRIHPDGPVRATHIHGITDADVADAPRFADLAITIGTALQDLVLVAHNAEFDVAFLRAEFARAGLPMPRFTTYCTLQGSTAYLPQLRRRTLAECCAALGVTQQGEHSALGDAQAAAGLLERYLAMDRQTGDDIPLTASRALRGEAGTELDLSPTAIRAWARSQGIPVGDRGRLKQELVAQYRAA